MGKSIDGDQLMSRCLDFLSIPRIGTQSARLRLRELLLLLHSTVECENQISEKLGVEYLPSKAHQQWLAMSRIPFSTRPRIPPSNLVR